MPSTWKLRDGVTWRQKLQEEHPNHGKLVPIPPPWQKRHGKGMMLIPRPLDVEAALRKVRKGKLMTQGVLRAQLAEAAGAETSCPMTTGLFARMVAEAVEEDLRAGKKRVTPYWRLVRDDGKLIEKFPGGPDSQAARLREEGFTVDPGKGKQPPRVRDHEKYLVGA